MEIAENDANLEKRTNYAVKAIAVAASLAILYSVVRYAAPKIREIWNKPATEYSQKLQERPDNSQY